jgi:two-component system response regulator AtoC
MSATVLIVDDEDNARINLKKFLAGIGYEFLEAANLTEARQQLSTGNVDMILLDVQLNGDYGPELLEDIVDMNPRPPVILITGYGNIETAVDAMKNGAHDFLQKPIDLDQLEKTLLRAKEQIDLRRELEHLRSIQHGEYEFIIGNSQAMKEAVTLGKRAAATGISILITGENGTGKEVLARAIHQFGPRSQKQFIDVNCPGIQPTMFESELFGHESGSFTGADKRKHGLMELADGGTLFLDEIATLPIDMQSKFLRALEERAFRRVGGNSVIKVDVQLLSASNRDLMEMIKEGKFREDLYYRLNVLELHIPPLRERRDDIPELVGYFICKNNRRMGERLTGVTPRALEALMAHNWPGNIRELRNIIERAMLFCDDPEIDLPHLPIEIRHLRGS